MTRFLSILIASCLQIGLQANAQTPPAGSPPPPPYTVADLEPYSVTDGVTNYNVTVVPFLIATGVDEATGKTIFEAPPAWMLEGPPNTTIKVTFYDSLTEGEVWSAEYTPTGRTAFAKTEIIHE